MFIGKESLPHVKAGFLFDTNMSEAEGVLTLRRNEHTYCKIHLFGATIIDYTHKDTKYLYLSSKAVLNGRSAIRGGIPIVFPNFGPWELGPQHGFARISWWRVEQPPVVTENGDVNASFVLEDSDETKHMWPHKFKLMLVVDLLEDGLKTSFEVFNKDDREISFTCLLHSYFNVADVTCTKLTGFKSSELNDKINCKKENVVADELHFNGLVDSIYHNTLTIHDIHGKDVSIRLIKEHFPDTVVWNPWDEKASKMADMGEGEWKNMLCIEAGRVVEPVILEPGCSFQASQTIKTIK